MVCVCGSRCSAPACSAHMRTCSCMVPSPVLNRSMGSTSTHHLPCVQGLKAIVDTAAPDLLLQSA